MSPKAEVYVPRGTSREALEQAVQNLGAKVGSWEDLGYRIDPSHITILGINRHMIDFLRDINPALGLMDYHSYSDIFSRLRKLPQEEQERLLMEYYTEDFNDLPHAAKLAGYLAEVNTLSNLFRPDSTSLDKAKDLASQFYQFCDLPPRTIKFVTGGWSEFIDLGNKKKWWDRFGFDKAIKMLVDASDSGERVLAKRLFADTNLDPYDLNELDEEDRIGCASSLSLDIGFAAGQAAWCRVYDQVEDEFGRDWAREIAGEPSAIAGDGAKWIVMQTPELVERNPFEVVMKIYGEGLLPIGTAGKEFVIFIPPVQGGSKDI